MERSGGRGYFVTGVDTGVGKSVACAWLVRRLDGAYWKPIQSGLDGETDTEVVARLSGLPSARFFPPAASLRAPLSPHEAARLEGVVIRPEDLSPPVVARPLIVEGAGGVMVPINQDDFYMVDFMVMLGLPVILVCHTRLGAINHALLSLEALRHRRLTVAGVIFSGRPNPVNREAIARCGRVAILAEIPWLEPLDPKALAALSPLIDWVAAR